MAHLFPHCSKSYNFFPSEDVATLPPSIGAICERWSLSTGWTCHSLCNPRPTEQSEITSERELCLTAKLLLVSVFWTSTFACGNQFLQVKVMGHKGCTLSRIWKNGSFQNKKITRFGKKFERYSMNWCFRSAQLPPWLWTWSRDGLCLFPSYCILAVIWGVPHLHTKQD
jgi:hypothetical protein